MLFKKICGLDELGLGLAEFAPVQLKLQVVWNAAMQVVMSHSLGWLLCLYLPMILTFKTFRVLPTNHNQNIPARSRFQHQEQKSSNNPPQPDSVIQFDQSADGTMRSGQSNDDSRLNVISTATSGRTLSDESWIDYKTRFDNVARLYDGAVSLERLFNSHVCVSNIDLYMLLVKIWLILIVFI